MKKHIFSYLKAIGSAVAIYLITLLICSGITLIKDLQDKYIYYIGLAPIVFGAITGGCLCAVFEKKNGLLNGILSQCIFFLLISAISFALSGEATLMLLIPLGICIFFGGAGGAVGVNIIKR